MEEGILSKGFSFPSFNLLVFQHQPALEGREKDGSGNAPEQATNKKDVEIAKMLCHAGSSIEKAVEKHV